MSWRSIRNTRSAYPRNHPNSNASKYIRIFSTAHYYGHCGMAIKVLSLASWTISKPDYSLYYNPPRLRIINWRNSLTEQSSYNSVNGISSIPDNLPHLSWESCGNYVPRYGTAKSVQSPPFPEVMRMKRLYCRSDGYQMYWRLWPWTRRTSIFDSRSPRC